MKQHIVILILLIIAYAFVKCRNRSAIEKNIVETQEINLAAKIEEAKIDEYEIIDTTIFLSGIKSSRYKGDKLTSGMAEEILYQHFVKKGYFRSDKIPEVIKKEDGEKLAVYYDTTYLVNLNQNKFNDAIICFWLTPPGASGHCWQPHKAIISDADKGYKISNEEFIPTNFAINSVANQNNKSVIFGYDYDCGNHKVLRNLRLVLETDEK